MAGLSFGTQGATPNNGAMGWLGSFGYKPTQNTTPAASALNSAQVGPNRSVVPPQPATPAPSTAVKSTTVSHPDGTSIATTYHPPTPGLLSSTPVSQDKTYDPKAGGVTNIGGVNYQGGVPVSGYTSGDSQYSQSNVQAPQAAIPTTFPGMVDSLANASQNGSQTANTAATGLLQAPQQNQTIGDKASQIAHDYGQKIADVGGQGARFQAGQLTTGTSPVAQGNAAITAQSTAAQQQALATGEAADLQGIGYQLTGQNQGQQGLNEAGALGNQSQGLVQSGLTSAGTLAQPSPTAQGQTTYNPLTNSFSGGSYGTNLQTVVQAIKSGNMGYTDGVNSLAGLSPTAKADVLAALGPNFDAVASDANAGARGTNITTSGTTGTSTAAQGYSGAAQTYTAYQGANTAAESQAKQVQSILGSTGLNSGVPDYNKAINSLAGRLGATNVAQLSTALTELQNMYSQILSVGGTTPTGSEAQALQVLNPNSSAAQINASIQQLQQASYNRGTGLYSQLQTYSNNLGQGGSTGNTASAGGGWGSLGD